MAKGRFGKFWESFGKWVRNPAPWKGSRTVKYEGRVKEEHKLHPSWSLKKDRGH